MAHANRNLQTSMAFAELTVKWFLFLSILMLSEKIHFVRCESKTFHEATIIK